MTLTESIVTPPSGVPTFRPCKTASEGPPSRALLKVTRDELTAGRLKKLAEELSERPVAVLAREEGLTPERAPVLNLGNVHYTQGRRKVTPSVFLSGAELDGLRRLAAAGFRVEARAVPLDAPIDLAEIERRWNAAG